MMHGRVIARLRSKPHCQQGRTKCTNKLNKKYLEDDGRVEGSRSFHDGVGRGGRGHVDGGDGETELLRGGEEFHHLRPNPAVQQTRASTKPRCFGESFEIWATLGIVGTEFIHATNHLIVVSGAITLYESTSKYDTS